MADYKDIVGTAVRNNAGNLSADQKDQIFYDSTNVDFKYQFEAKADAWRTSSPLNTASWSRTTGGSVNSAWAASGEVSGSGFVKINEIWNGTTWSEANDNSISHYGGNGSHGVPNNTTGLVFFGYDPTIPGDHSRTEEWNGTSWTELSDGNTVRRFPGGNGTTTEACLVYGGLIPGSSFTNTELWNGSSWTETTDINTARYGTNGIGSSTSAAYVNGSLYPGPQPPGTFHEQWNGSTWTESTDPNQKVHGAGSGIVNTAMVIFGGNPTGYTEVWNGSTWTETTDLNEARDSQGGTGAGGATSALSVGGIPPGGQPNGSSGVEEFVSNLPIGAWSTSTSMNTARYHLGGAGITTAALAFGGHPASGLTESWDGSTWTEVNNLTTARGMGASIGLLYTAALYAGGASNNSETWNGSNWTEVADLNTAKEQTAGAGTTTSGLVFGGRIPPGTVNATTESWNGASWTEVSDLNTARRLIGGTGASNTAAIGAGGYSTTYTSLVETWNGSSWSETSNLNNAETGTTMFGTSTSAIAAGGYQPGSPNVLATTEDWNGISWQEVADLNTGRELSAASKGGSPSSGFLFGGHAGPAATAVAEEWTGSSNTIKVLTD